MSKHLYMRVSEVLEQRIADKTYPRDSLLPTEQELQEEFGVSERPLETR